MVCLPCISSVRDEIKYILYIYTCIERKSEGERERETGYIAKQLKNTT